MAGKGVSMLKSIPNWEGQLTSERDLEDLSDDELDKKIFELTIMKLKKSGKYSMRFKNKDKEGKLDRAARCSNCNCQA